MQSPNGQGIVGALVIGIMCPHGAFPEAAIPALAHEARPTPRVVSNDDTQWVAGQEYSQPSLKQQLGLRLTFMVDFLSWKLELALERGTCGRVMRAFPG